MKKTSELWNFYIKELKRCIVEFKDKKTRKKQIANMLTASRLLAPLVLLPLAFLKLYVPTIILTIMFALTDAFDGYFARKYDAVTNFGKDLDAIVDKIFAATILISISFINLWLLILVFMEAIIALVNVVEKYNINVIDGVGGDQWPNFITDKATLTINGNDYYFYSRIPNDTLTPGKYDNSDLKVTLKLTEK